MKFERTKVHFIGNYCRPRGILNSHKTGCENKKAGGRTDLILN